VPRQPNRNRNVSSIAIAPSDVAQTVRRVRQPVEENRGARRGTIRLEQIRAIPVLRKMAGIDRTAVEIPIGGNAVFGSKFLSNLRADVLKNPLLSLQIFSPAGLIKFNDAQLIGYIGMPWRQWPASLRVIDTDCQKRGQNHKEQDPPRFNILNARPGITSTVLNLPEQGASRGLHQFPHCAVASLETDLSFLFHG
jgi:hypothetical protein